MSPQSHHFARRAKARLKWLVNAVGGRLAIGLIKVARRTDPDRSADRAGRLMRRVGPLLPEHRTGRANLAAVFPDKSRAELEAILAGVWDNLGRLGAEYAHLDRLWDYDDENPTKPSRIEFAPRSRELFMQLRNDGKPALIFAAHLANWELPAIAAAAHGLDGAILFRRPNQSNVADEVLRLRGGGMGAVELVATGLDAPLRLAHVLARGGHVGMLVDQYYVRGVEVTFFGRRTNANPLIARLARQFDCPIHGARAIRLPGHRFRLELTEAVTPARDAQGRVDVAGTMQAIMTIIEAWVREHPEQWLWVHRRWRGKEPPRRSARSG